MSTLNLPSSPASLSTLGRCMSLTAEEKDRRRRSMIIPPSSQTSLPDVDLEITPSGRKLKRLSLCAGGTTGNTSTSGGGFRPSSLELERSSSGSCGVSMPSSPLPTPSLDRRPSTPVGASAGGVSGGPGSRRPDRRIGVRASISYSPAPPHIAHTPRTGERRSYEDDWETRIGLGERYDLHLPERELSEGDEEDIPEGDERVRAGGQTLTEKHADLLTLIAQRERRVNELKQELRQQEASLSTLKSRWTSIVSRSALSPTSISIPSHSLRDSHSHSHTHPTPAPTRRARPMSMISNSTSSASSLSLATIDEPTAAASAIAIPNGLILPTGGLSSTGAAVLSGLMAQTEGYLGPEVVEGGKRFLGTLWRTVGAAAGGTVPEQELSENTVANTGSRLSSGDAAGLEKRRSEKGTQRGKELSNGVWEQRETDSNAVDGQEGSQFGPKLDLSNIQRMITPWSTPTPTFAGPTPTSTCTSTTAFESRVSADSRPATMKRGRQENDSRSNTVTPTSFYANLIAGSPISARMMAPLSPSHSTIDLPESGSRSSSISGSEVDAEAGIDEGRSLGMTMTGFQLPVPKQGVIIENECRTANANAATGDVKDDDGGEGWGW
ncbi:hypothetical protein I316_04459 [Kwoniella heveanensis BCC8398]|uniref:DUF4048 domain-containing protein n=1 Tax=Kwoniella heveanensis BCC8398 TaxID=1296120 RepID=A0A1B9GRX8_9TREE|nr:hypothetical protein I316_04459 [Kwoniella heveanensis BCC8398]